MCHLITNHVVVKGKSMRERKVNFVKLKRMLLSGKIGKQCAEYFGVSEAAISKAKKAINVAVVKNVALESAPKVVEKNLNAVDQLQKINADANEILDLLMRWNRGDEVALQILESQVKYVKVNGQEEPVKEYKMKDPRELALKAMAEIRNQLKLQLDIFQTLYDLQAVKEFQQEVLKDIGEASPDVRDKIINNLKQKRAIRQSIKFD